MYSVTRKFYPVEQTAIKLGYGLFKGVHRSVPDEPQVCHRPAYQATSEVSRCTSKLHNSATHGVWTVGRLDSAAIEQESHRAWGATLSLAERVHQLLQSSSPLNLEEDFVVVIGDLDIEVVIVLGFLWYCWATAVV